jgi:SPP1 gp7 family putative phage head morphogenesis protein
MTVTTPFLGNLQSISNRFTDELDRKGAGAVYKMQQSYAGSIARLGMQYDDVTNMIAERRAQGLPVPVSWVHKQDRYASLTLQARREFDRYGADTFRMLQGAQEDAVNLAMNHANAVLEWELPGHRNIVGAFNAIPTSAVEQLTAQLSNSYGPVGQMLGSFGRDAAKLIDEALTDGLVQGLHPNDIGRRMRDSTGVLLERSKTIARTEMYRAYREGNRATYAANDDIVEKWVWNAHQGGRTCAACLAMDGEEFPVTEPMGSHPNCFVAGTLISGDTALAGSKRWYEGEFVKITTASGVDFTVTPNHPILTSKGWVAAGNLDESCYLIRSGDTKRGSPQIPNDYDVPSRIEDVVESLSRARGVGSVTVPTTAVDFHGDGVEGEVDIVFSDSLLRNGVLADEFGQEQVHNLFVGRGDNRVLLASLGGLDEGFVRNRHTASCDVCGARVLNVFVGGSGTHIQPVRVGDAAPRNAVLVEAALNNRSTYAVPDCETIFRFAGNVTPDKVVSVERYFGRHFVYNLETSVGWYIANGIIAHNCRCTMLPKTKTWAELGFPELEETNVTGDSRPRGEEWLKTQPESVQRQAFGNNKLYQGWKDGEYNLKDTVRTVDNPQWGRTRTIGGYDNAVNNAKLRKLREDAERRDREDAEAARLAAEKAAAVKPARKPRAPTWEKKAKNLMGPPNQPGTIRSEEQAREVGAIIRTQLEKQPTAKRLGQLEHEIAAGKDEYYRLARVNGDISDELYSYENPPTPARRKELEKLQKETDRLHRELDARRRGLAQEQAELTKKRAEEVAETLRKVRPGYGQSTAKMTYLKGSEKVPKQLIEDQRALLPKEWFDDFADETIETKTVQRGYFLEPEPNRGRPQTRIMTSGHGAEQSSSTMIHELGHFAEQKRPWIPNLEREFYNRRTAGEALEHMGPGYPTSEVARRDKFEEIYCGKDYGGSYFELVSMGIQSVFRPGHNGMNILNDEDFYDFILGILAGA